MQQINCVIVSLINYNSLIRDTLEYTLKRDSYNVQYYDYKKQGIYNGINLNTPLKNFLEKNGEKGESLLKRLHEFADEFYGDNATAIKKDLATNTIRVDHAQNISILKAVVPLHEEITAIVRIHEKWAEEHKVSEKIATDLIAADERFYRAVALSCINEELVNQFQEFNKVMQESKGVAGPASNFVQQELNTAVGLYNVVKQQATCKDEVYTNALDEITKMVEMMSGKRDLPKGKTFRDVFNDSKLYLAAFIEDAEKSWRTTFEPAMNELVAEEKKLKEAQEAAKKEAGSKEEAPKAENK